MFLLISALLLGFGVPYYSSTLSLISALMGFIPLFYDLKVNRSFLLRFVRGLLVLTTAHAIQTIWFLSHPFAYIYPVWIGLALFVATPQAILFALRLPPSLCAFGIAFLEYLRLHILCGYSFNPISLPLVSNEFMALGIPIIGSIGASFFLVWFQLLFTYTPSRALLPLILYAVICSMSFQIPKTVLKPFEVAILSTNYLPELDSSFKQLRGSSEEKWGDFFRLLHEVKKEYPETKLDLILMPEGFTPFAASTGYLLKQQLSSLQLADLAAKQMNCSIVIGLEGQEANLAYNSAFLVSPNQPTKRYDKQVLVPLGEYIPFTWLASHLEPYGVFSLYTSGKNPVNFEINGITCSPTICYEETFPTVTRLHKLANAELLLNLTNDAWYPNSSLGASHFEHAKIRSLELGAFLLRSCNMGKSGVIDLFGNEIPPKKAIQIGKSSLLLYSITPAMRTTPFEWLGCEGVLLVLLLFCILLQRTPGGQKL